MKFLGFEIKAVSKEIEQEALKSVAPEHNEDGAMVLDVGMNTTFQGSAAGDAYGYSTSFDFDADAVEEAQLIAKYREISIVAEVEAALDDIINEFVSTDKNTLVTIDLDQLKYSEAIKNKIRGEFNHILKLLDFNNKAYEIIRRWYVDGRLNYQVVVDKNTYKQIGIGKLTYIDPRHLKKVRVVKSGLDPDSKAVLYNNVDEFFLFSDTGFTTASPNTASTEGIKLTSDSIVSITSGLMNHTNRITLSFLHKAIRPLNLLKSLEDSSVIYRLSRAPERRVFYIDVGNLPPNKAEQVMRRQMQQFRSKPVFDPATGLVKTDAKHMTMVEDFFLPRNGSGKATEIDVLQSGTQLGEMEEVNFMLQKLYKALNVPTTRLDNSSGFMLGRVTEISRDEVKFMKFISRIRRRFSQLFVELLRRQLALKGVMSTAEFDSIRTDISFEFASDNTFNESLQNEVIMGRLNVLQAMNDFVGIYFSKAEVLRDVLHKSKEQIDETLREIEEEGSAPNLVDDMPTPTSQSQALNQANMLHQADVNQQQLDMQAAAAAEQKKEAQQAKPAPKGARPGGNAK